MKAKNILVTGGAGHIGSELIKMLVEMGYSSVYSLDNYSNGSERNHAAGCEYINGCTSDMSKIFSDMKFDTIFHFGEFSRVEQSFTKLDEVLTSNYLGTKEVLKLALKDGSRLIYSCSSAIGSIISENLINSPYVISKLNNKLLIDSFFRQGILNGNIIYFSNVYGGNEKATGENATVVAKFLTAARANKTVTINGPGTQSRQFTHVQDVLSALKLIFERKVAGEFAIAADEKVSIIELANLIGVNYVIGDPVMGNRNESRVNTTALKKLGWRANYSLKEYIANEVREI